MAFTILSYFFLLVCLNTSMSACSEDEFDCVGGFPGDGIVMCGTVMEFDSTAPIGGSMRRSVYNKTHNEAKAFCDSRNSSLLSSEGHDVAFNLSRLSKSACFRQDNNFLHLVDLTYQLPAFDLGYDSEVVYTASSQWMWSGKHLVLEEIFGPCDSNYCIFTDRYDKYAEPEYRAPTLIHTKAEIAYLTSDYLCGAWKMTDRWFEVVDCSERLPFLCISD